MPIIRINNYIDENVSSESEYSLSPIRNPYQRDREIYINNRNISTNIAYSPSNNSSSSYSSNEISEEDLNIQVDENDIENNLVSRNNLNEENDYETCLICTENFKDICLLRCGHVICLNCLIRWFKTSKTCPFCREEINNLDIGHLYNRVNVARQYESEVEEEKCFTCRTFERFVCYSSLIYFTYTLLVPSYSQ